MITPDNLNLRIYYASVDGIWWLTLRSRDCDYAGALCTNVIDQVPSEHIMYHDYADDIAVVLTEMTKGWEGRGEIRGHEYRVVYTDHTTLFRNILNQSITKDNQDD